MRETMGANNGREENDFYTTAIQCVKDIAELEEIEGKTVLDNSAGTGNISETLKDLGNLVYTVDLIDRGYPLDYHGDFLTSNIGINFDVAVYNPPFTLTSEFIEKTWEHTNKQILFQRLQFLESIKRYKGIFSRGYLKKVYIYSSRQITNDNHKANSICFCWFVLENNQDNQNNNDPIIKWII